MTIAAREHWEEHFAAGDGFLGVTAAEMRMFTEQVAPAAGASVLDIGCGLGGYAAELVWLGCRTMATDWAASSVAAVRDRYEGLLPGLTVQRLDFEDDQAVGLLPQAGFDVVTMRLVFAFMRDKEAAAERVRRLLAPGGVWVVTTSLADRLSARRHIGITGKEVAGLLEGWGSGVWYDLEPGGVRCFVLRR
ncbi:class I SAM-dependent methyltransferase [Streptomyces sp. NBC_01003]|uniref:class I SAM-dependent methyltransferase n=1 Tax=Streptomyces sp. NBC_01003 TaxID=2903714 RepID=UPI003868C8B2|nr:class I SAM-dependent methyltransferase [Streptomyces sp. NBC_01003]